MSYKTIETKTIEIFIFLKNNKIRPHLKFKFRSDINLKINKPLNPSIIPESELLSNSNLIPPKSKTKKSNLIPPKSKTNKIKDNKDPYNKLNKKAIKTLEKEINSSSTKDILGIKLSKKAINNLTTEKVIVLTWFIRALIKTT